MQIARDTVVELEYSLRETEGEVLESSQATMPLAYLHGHNNLLPALERALVGKAAGDDVTVNLAPEEAYGERREQLTQRVPIKHLSHAPKRLAPGMVVRMQTERGAEPARVLKVGKFNVDLDLNHPFAGKHLQFDLKVVSVRAATAEEIAHGHAHGPGGHHHH